ncbi:phage regulatory protein/antirepressor Ant [Ochrobactrum sp. SFR4]|uniref:phage regulatory protein/antirepressor Ant n=1 Tax=Ochrobactrum sp. SFR4 TaxID=2717368 RepID=UPI001C8B4488|nr:phage regulatory protein/antirepressor Ant [Ochrobactrum sp. SFR4]MBX8825241.1 hypothetical protein [Ochrobactrum sp. SFR4]
MELNTNLSRIAIQSSQGASLTMSSREIAALCEKDHKNVKRDIEAMCTGLEINALTFELIYKDSRNRDQKEYCLPKDLTLTLVAGYNVKLRKRIIDRWMELEEVSLEKAKPLDFSSPAVVLGVIGHLQGQVRALEGRSKTLTRLEGAKGSMCISDAAKTLGVQRKWLFDFMSSRRWIFKRAGNKNWLAYDDKRKSLLLEHDDHIYMDDIGQERVSTRVLVTAKGLVKLAELIEQPLH